MLNRYPLWKYILICLVIVLGFLYALPNLYGEYHSLQITRIHGIPVENSLIAHINGILKQQIPSKSLKIENASIEILFPNQVTQLNAREVLVKELGGDYIVALHLLPATPSWLARIGAKPMKLGLDLRGGVHFLMKVDTDTALSKIQKQMMESLFKDLDEKNIIYKIAHKTNHDCSKLVFHDFYTRDIAISLLAPLYPDLIINKMDNNCLIVGFNPDYLHKKSNSIVQHNISILHNRVNQLGVEEPLIQRQGFDCIAVELPGIQDPAHAKEILGTTATLEFRLVNNQTDQNIYDVNQIPENSEVKWMRDGNPILLYKKIILTGDHITSSTTINGNNIPQVNVSLDRVGSTAMFNFTKDNIGKLMATLFVEYKDSGKKDSNGQMILIKHEEVINLATIQSRLGTNFQIIGINNMHEADQLSLLLRAGTLMAPVQIIEERTIGPTLGIQNITRSLEACLGGLIVCMMFMLIWYRKFGVIAITSIIANLIIIVGIMSLLPGVTLTMPSIAGILLTIAVSVDSNVLINERIKEELNNRCNVQIAIHEGYRGAFSSIVDANITMMITSIILYTLGIGSIKGFAITTFIGVVTSMFTSVIGTRAIVNLLYGGKYIDKLSI